MSAKTFNIPIDVRIVSKTYRRVHLEIHLRRSLRGDLPPQTIDVTVRTENVTRKSFRF